MPGLLSKKCMLITRKISNFEFTYYFKTTKITLNYYYLFFLKTQNNKLFKKKKKKNSIRYINSSHKILIQKKEQVHNSYYYTYSIYILYVFFYKKIFAFSS